VTVQGSSGKSEWSTRLDIYQDPEPLVKLAKPLQKLLGYENCHEAAANRYA